MSPELFSASSSVLTSIANALGLDIEVLTELGEDPVGGSDPTQAIDRAYAPDKNGISNMDRAADAVADADNMDAKGNKQEAFEDALEKPDNMRRTTVGGLKKEGLMQDGILMSDGPGGDEFKAKKFIVGLPDDTPVRVGTFEYIDKDGVTRTETFYIFEQCANPAVDAGEDDIVPQKPVCAPGTSTVAGEELAGNSKHPEDITVAVVSNKVEDIGEIWQDKDGDGDAWDSRETDKGVKYSIDNDEVNMDALPSEDQIEKDIAAYQAQHEGKKPEHLWYSFEDCNGKSIVLCYDIENERWGILKDKTWQPSEQDVIAGPVIDTKGELDAYLTKERVPAK